MQILISSEIQVKFNEPNKQANKARQRYIKSKLRFRQTFVIKR
jgi:hypothetical protein